jgi:hypothetical protein
MGYSNEEPFKDREHIKWEIGYCGKAANYVSYLCFILIALGIISDLFSMKLGLGATSWFLLAIFAAIIGLGPILHSVLARHLLGMEVVKKDQ